MTDRRAFSTREMLFAVIVIGLVAAVAIPNYRAYEEAKRRDVNRSCYAWQKTIIGALEMYNLDRNTKRTQLDDSTWFALSSGGYLNSGSPPLDPGGGPGSHRNFSLTRETTGITCKVHGTYERPADR